MSAGARRPRALVVYESMFGNSGRIASAVADGLRAEGVETELVEVGSAPGGLTDGLDLLVVGAPTHAFSLSRPRTRADAVRQGAASDRARLGLREWLGAVALDTVHRPPVVAFDTRVSKVRRLRSAAPSALRLARKRGLEPASRPVGFLVDDVKGPLVDGELERATSWGRQLARQVVARADAAEVSARPAPASSPRSRRGRAADPLRRG